MRLALIALALLLMPTGAEARECLRYGICYVHREWPNYSYRTKCCKEWGTNYTYRLPEDSYGYRGDYDLSRRADRRDCRDVRRTVGDQHLTLDGAKKAANEAWSALVRFHLGERMMDLNNAKHITYTCSRSSIKEGGVTTLGQTLSRCELSAVPCSPPPEHEKRERED